MWKPDAPQKAATVTRTMIASPFFCSNPDSFFYDNFTISPWWLRSHLVSYRHPKLLIERCMCITFFIYWKIVVKTVAFRGVIDVPFILYHELHKIILCDRSGCFFPKTSDEFPPSANNYVILLFNSLLPR